MSNSNFIFENLIPINFMGGTGGTFLCHFLTSAKLNIRDLYVFGDYGSMHDYGNRTRNLELPTHAHSVVDRLDKKIDYIKSFDFPNDNQPKNPPFFTTIHHQGDINLLLDHFNKFIHISYKETDSSEIAAIFACKNYIEPKLNAESEFEELHTNFTRFVGKLSTNFNEITNNAICNISWDDLIRNDVDILITKLADFTGIPKENFVSENVINWRKKTRDSVAKFGYIVK